MVFQNNNSNMHQIPGNKKTVKVNTSHPTVFSSLFHFTFHIRSIKQGDNDSL